MTSESPGDGDGVGIKDFSRNKNLLSNENTFNYRDRSQCLYLGNKLAIYRALFALILSLLVVGCRTEGFCDPLLCSCQLSSANCSWRGLLTLPAGLHDNIKYLDLSNNDIQEINNTDLSLYSNLEVLDLSKNKINSFQGGKLSKIFKLDLSHNEISTLRRITLSQLRELVSLDLSYNKISSIPGQIFPQNSKLQTLNFASNNLEILEPKCFHNLEHLKELKLNRNRLSSLPKQTFINLQNLQVLELNKNKLEKIPGLTFHGLKNVKILKLRKNNLRYLDDGAFYGLDSIEELYLDRNQVVTVNKGWLYGLVTLQVLSLSYNQVDYIEDDGWEFCKQVYRLNLQGNQLEIVERSILRRLPSLKFLNLQDNLISHIEARDTFQEVPLLEELLLDGNLLSHTIEDTQAPFKHLEQLKVLGLSRNNIKSIGNLALVGLKHIEKLDFSDNIISTVQENPFSELSDLRTLSLTSSSLLCDCNLRWLAEFVNKTQVGGVTGVCAHPENLKDRPVTSVESEMFTCDDFPKPYILVEPASQIALRGKDLTLYCRAASTSPAEMNFVWKKDGSVVEEEHCPAPRSCVENIAHSFDGKGMEVTSELRLTNLTHLDIGSYQCIVENLYGATYSVKAALEVYVFPQFVLTPEDKTVQGGTSVSLKCSATGVPKPDISWQKDSGSDFPAARERRLRVDPQSNTYVITKVKAEDMGTYTCTATNLAGSITTNTSLTVLERPRFVKPMTNKTVRLGETAVLECQATGAPRPSLAWSKDGGLLIATERHFFTADNQLVIIVKVEAGDEGSYQCTMHNNLGTLTGTSRLTVAGGGKAAKPATGTTSVIVIAVICCVIGTSAIWMFIICYSRARSRDKRRDWASQLEAVKDLETPTSGMPLLEGDGCKNEDAVSERDSGTGDSKQSDNVDTADSIVDTVIHNFLTARGEQGQWMLTSPYNTTSLSDFDTGISSLGESGSLPPQSLQSLHRRGCPKLKVKTERTVPAVASVSYAVDNPLYDSLPQQGDLTGSPPPSTISDQWPASCHGGTEEDSASTVSSARSVPLSDLPLTFNTFQPQRSRKHKHQRLSAIELPTGKTPTEPPPTSPTSTEAAREYRGGGTLPKHGLQQEWLEASLNYAEAEARQETNRSNREKGSRRSIFRSSRRSQAAASDRGSSHTVNTEEHSNVGSKGREMF